MASESKARLLYVLKLLEQYSDEEHPLTTADLLSMLMDKYGISPKAYINNLRIDFAKKLLTRSEMSITEISYSIGFMEPLYFSTSFRKSTGISPTEFRERYKDQ